MGPTSLAARGGVWALAQSGGSFDPKGPAAREMEQLWWIMLWLGVAAFAVFAAALAFGLLRRRAESDTEPADEASPAARRWLVGGGVVLPVVVISVVFGFTLSSMRVIPNSGGPGALVVEVVGNQWWWEIRYPDHGIVTANEMHIPVGRPVELRLTSADVIHSFWVPELAGKMDLLPEDENILVLQSDEAGEFRGKCAEFCGLQHANMQFLVVAQSADDFQGWVNEQQQPASDPTGDIASRGHELFANNCAQCHTVRGTTAAGTKGPDLTHLATRRTLGAATLLNTPDNLSEWVSDAQQFKSGIEMAPHDVAPDDLEPLLTYLESLQ